MTLPSETPVSALGRGAVAGLAATALLSVLSRVTDPLWQRARQPGGGGNGGGGKPKAPEDPFDPAAVDRWQRQYQSPAAYQPQSGGQRSAGSGRHRIGEGEGEGAAGAAAGGVSPAAVLAQAPGPEGLAAQFAHKLAAGLFGRDISPYARPAGEAVHFTYGTLWGALYGLLQSNSRYPPGPFGTLFGLIVWLVGPATLVPAMRLMLPPPREHPIRLMLMIAGHLVYGLAVAATFKALEREAAA